MRIAMPSPAHLSLDAWLVAQSHEPPAGGYGERELARHAERIRRIPKEISETRQVKTDGSSPTRRLRIVTAHRTHRNRYQNTVDDRFWCAG
ncbi:hypothetical protein [Actinorhabdospora filicis]|nr:hypothetical protein [Actinorhabdospora filicis]